MTIYGYIIIAFWIILFATWIVGFFTAKHSVRTRNWKNWILFRVAIIIIVLAALRIPSVDSWFKFGLNHHSLFLIQSNPLWGFIGVLVTALGVGIAIWARIILGRNWGMPLTERAEPELVTNGPYSYIRHPIYTGFILGMVGATIGESLVWLIPLILSTPYFVYSALGEDKQMLRIFPKQYPAYFARTKRLIPWFW
jgi:protein-S-isoprenylcysteine O-methyltransferase Ste14